MRPTVEYLRERFARFNTLIFGGRLPEPAITLCQVSSFVAQHKAQVRVLEDGRRELYGHQLRFSTSFDLPERELEDTLIHEMIHYFLAYHGLQDRSPHGPLFKAMMASVNENHGRNIGISRRTSRGEMDEARAARKKWHVVAILHFSSGELGVKVLPRVIPRIVEYHRGISSAANISKVNLYLTNDPFFNRFPTSTGRRCQAIAREEASLHLRGAHVLEVRGGKVIQK